MTEANPSADAFAAEAGSVPVVVSGDEVPTATPEALNTFVNHVEEAKEVTPGQKFYTEEDLAKVRTQEKNKLYSQIEGLKEEVESLSKARKEELAAKAAEEAEKQRQLKLQEEAEMDVRELLSTKEQEWKEQLELERQERERAFALLEREKTFAEIQAYRQQRLDQERDNIIPELIDLITGETPEEIEASIAGLKQRSERILESAQSAMREARRDMAGTRVTAPQAGPMDINTGNRQFTAEEIAAMSLNDYAKYRQQLLSDKAQGRSKGIFG